MLLDKYKFMLCVLPLYCLHSMDIVYRIYSTFTYFYNMDIFQEPLFLDRCIVCCEADWEDYFEIQELPTKDTFIFKVWYLLLLYDNGVCTIGTISIKLVYFFLI